MTSFWLSWIHNSERMGEFELHWPWWISGHTADDSETICAAIRAENALAAQSVIYHAYDNPTPLTFRFCGRRDTYWSPFTDRFPRADWMEWEENGG